MDYQKTLRGLKAVGTVWGSSLHEELTKRIVEHSDVVRLICHTQMMQKLKQLRQKKSHIMEIQVNGGSIEDKVNFCKSKLEQAIRVGEVYSTNDMTDTIAVTKGRGTEGVITRWGITRLPRKTHRGLRKVACIGAWHPARVSYTVARVGQNGYHHRTETNKKIYFVRYGEVKQDFIMIKGSCPDLVKRPVTLRRSLIPPTNSVAKEEVTLKWIDTSSNF